MSEWKFETDQKCVYIKYKKLFIGATFQTYLPWAETEAYSVETLSGNYTPPLQIIKKTKWKRRKKQEQKWKINIIFCIWKHPPNGYTPYPISRICNPPSPLPPNDPPPQPNFWLRAWVVTPAVKNFSIQIQQRKAIGKLTRSVHRSLPSKRWDKKNIFLIFSKWYT